jgi:hypothetical protein
MAVLVTAGVLFLHVHPELTGLSKQLSWSLNPTMYLSDYLC